MAAEKKQTKTQKEKMPVAAETKEELKHYMVPKHIKLSDEEAQKILEIFKAGINDLPKIKMSDPGVRHLNTKPGDIIKIERNSPTAKKTIYYRSVSK